MSDILIAISVFETFVGLPKVGRVMNPDDTKDWKGPEDYMGLNSEPGDYNFDPLGFKGQAAAGNFGFLFDKMDEKELANGRLAMLAFSGIVTQAALTGKTFPYVWWRIDGDTNTTVSEYSENSIHA